MKRKFKQWWSTIPPISTKQTILSELIEHKKKYDMTLEIQVLARDKHTYFVVLNQLMVSQRHI